MKKILFYYKIFFAGGIENSILKLAKKLHNNYEIFVAYDEESSNTVLDRIAEYAKIIDLNQIEDITVDTCIWCSHPRQGTFTEFAKKVKADKYYCWGHILLFDTYPNVEFSEDFLENIDIFISVSETVKEDILKRYPQLEKKSIVLENYLDIEEIRKKSEEKIELQVNNNKLNIITTARLARDKGYKRIKTLCDVLERNRINYDWYILGKAFTQDIYNEIIDIFKDNNNVHFLGYKNNVYPYIKQMDYMAILSDREANNLSISEALILGVPCIVSNFLGVTNQIIDGVNGIILDLNNTIENYTKKIKDIINERKSLKSNVLNIDQNKEYILDKWKSLL